MTPYVQLQTLKVNLYDDETCYNHAIDFDYWEKTKSSNSTDGDENNERPEEFDHYGYDYYGYDYYGYNYGNYYKPPYYPEHTFYNSEVEFCAGHYNMTTDTYTEDASSCYGDSGGPLVCINPNSTEPKVYGIVSWGYECGTPGFYAKTSAVIDWFDDVITGKYPPDPCDGGVCQMPEDVVSPGNHWFTNDLSDNDAARNRRNVLFEDGEIAREASWPWVVGITSTPKEDYCHVEVVSTNNICGSNNSNITYAEYNNFLNLEEIQEMNEIFSGL